MSADIETNADFSDIDKIVLVSDEDLLEKEKEAKKRRKTTTSSVAMMMPHEVGPSVDRLWTYQCPLTKGRNVSCMAWNKDNPVSIQWRGPDLHGGYDLLRFECFAVE